MPFLYQLFFFFDTTISFLQIFPRLQKYIYNLSFLHSVLSVLSGHSHILMPGGMKRWLIFSFSSSLTASMFFHSCPFSPVFLQMTLNELVHFFLWYFSHWFRNRLPTFPERKSKNFFSSVTSLFVWRKSVK